MVRFMLLILTGVLCASAADKSPGEIYYLEEFNRAFNLIRQADALEAEAPTTALEKYLQARQGLQRLRKQAPQWNSEIIQYRLNYIERHVGPLLATMKLPPLQDNPAVQMKAKDAKIARLTAELVGVRETLQRQETDYRAKLREALAAQPARLNPETLEKAQKQTLHLQEELLYLKTNYQKGSHRLDELTKDLAAAKAENTQLRSQLQAFAPGGSRQTLRLANDLLHKRVAELSQQSPSGGQQDALRRQIADLQKKLHLEQLRSRRLAEENKKLRQLINTPR